MKYFYCESCFHNKDGVCSFQPIKKPKNEQRQGITRWIWCEFKPNRKSLLQEIASLCLARANELREQKGGWIKMDTNNSKIVLDAKRYEQLLKREEFLEEILDGMDSNDLVRFTGMSYDRAKQIIREGL
jgi:hypothetical protein